MRNEPFAPRRFAIELIAHSAPGTCLPYDFLPQGHYRVRLVRITTGVISNIAGNGSQGSSGVGGLAVLATFSTVGGVAVDSRGVVYLSDTVRLCPVPTLHSVPPAPTLRCWKCTRHCVPGSAQKRNTTACAQVSFLSLSIRRLRSIVAVQLPCSQSRRPDADSRPDIDAVAHRDGAAACYHMDGR